MKTPQEMARAAGRRLVNIAREVRPGRLIGLILQRGTALIGIIIMLIVFGFMSPNFLTGSNFENILRQTSFTAILAVGQTFVILSGGIDLSVAATAALSVSVAAVFMTGQVDIAGSPPIGFWGGLFVALAVGGLAGFVNGLIITKGRIPDFIATLGAFVAYRGIANIVTGGLPVPSHVAGAETRAKLPDQMIFLGGGEVDLGFFEFPTSALGAVGVGLAAIVILRYTALGRSIFAVGGNREAARVSGINVDRIKIAVYTLSGLCAAFAGFILVGRLNSANANLGEFEELKSIASVIIGGANLFGGEGGAFGSLIGALTLGMLGNGLRLLNLPGGVIGLSEFWQRVVQGMVIVFVVMLDQWRRRRFGA